IRLRRNGSHKGEGHQAHPSCLSTQPWATAIISDCCSPPKMLMHIDLQLRSVWKVREHFMGMKDTSGGSNDTEAKVPTTKARNSPSSVRPVTMATPVG